MKILFLVWLMIKNTIYLLHEFCYIDRIITNPG